MLTAEIVFDDELWDRIEALDDQVSGGMARDPSKTSHNGRLPREAILR